MILGIIVTIPQLAFIHIEYEVLQGQLALLVGPHAGCEGAGHQSRGKDN